MKAVAYVEIRDFDPRHRWVYAYDADNNMVATFWPEGWKVALFHETGKGGHRAATIEEREELDALLEKALEQKRGALAPAPQAGEDAGSLLLPDSRPEAPIVEVVFADDVAAQAWDEYCSEAVSWA